MQRCDRKADRKEGFVATVSARALIVFAPKERSFAHGGTRPQRNSTRFREPERSAVTAMMFVVGGMFHDGRTASESDDDIWAEKDAESSLTGVASTYRPHIALG